jgi:hypothetical protein
MAARLQDKQSVSQGVARRSLVGHLQKGPSQLYPDTVGAASERLGDVAVTANADRVTGGRQEQVELLLSQEDELVGLLQLAPSA